MFKTLFETDNNFTEHNTVIYLQNDYRIFSGLTDEEKIDFFISKFANTIIDYKDKYGLGRSIRGHSKQSMINLNVIENKYLITVNLNFGYEVCTKLQNTSKQACFLWKHHEDEKLDKNILKNLWFLLFKNKNYPEVFNYTDDIIYNGCKMDNSKLLLEYVCRSSFTDVDLFVSELLDANLEFIKKLKSIWVD